MRSASRPLSLFWMVGLTASTTASGCVRELDMQAAAPSTPHATILYSGVRDVGRLYPDYGAIDRAILDDDEGSR